MDQRHELREQAEHLTTVLVGCTDARVWAEEFVKVAEQQRDLPTDADTMVGWFANAIMAGHDEATVRQLVRDRVGFRLALACHDANRHAENFWSWAGRKLPRRLRYWTAMGLLAAATADRELETFDVPGVTVEQLLPVMGRLTGQT